MSIVVELFLDARTALVRLTAAGSARRGKMEAACRLSGDRWRARTKRGWVE
jgi:hypothetical protein